MKKKLLALLLALALILGLASFAGAATHIVEEGDNLSKLAEQYLGSRLKWREIYEANKDKIANPNVIYVGQELVIPGEAESDPPVVPNEPEVPVVYNDVPFKTVDLPESDPDYFAALWEAEVYNYKMARSLPTLFEAEGWDNYLGASSTLLTYDGNNLTDVQKEKVLEAKAAHEALVQILPYEGIDGEVMYIWGDDMPVLTENVKELFTIDSWDNSDFAPYLIPYLVEDQSQAKGTLIIVSGGGNSTRSNEVEGYMVCPAFVELGYNCFLLQRRVQPYGADEIAMDLQRAIRYVRYHAETWGLGGMDIVGAAGFSGGGGNLRNLINKFYGDITPDQFDAGYTPDAIDAVNSDLDIAIFIYSAGALNTENPNIPHIFIGVGEDDGFKGSIELFQQLENPDNAAQFGNVNPELHIYGQNGHGFGAGLEGTSSMLWIESAHMYMQKVMGKAEKVYTGEIPAEYTKVQKVVMDWLPVGAVEANVYTTNSGDKFYVTFYAFASDQILEGILINGHVASITYDKSGYFAADAAKIWDLVDPAAWTPVE